MADAFKTIFQGYVLSAASAIYTTPGATQTIIRHMRFVNISSTPVAFQLWLNGTSDLNIMVPPATIDPSGWMEWDGVLCLSAGGSIAAKAAQVSAIVASLHGDEIT